MSNPTSVLEFFRVTEAVSFLVRNDYREHRFGEWTDTEGRMATMQVNLSAEIPVRVSLY